MLTKEASIEDLLFPENNCYQIPPFQRNYQWGEQQIHRLISDIRYAAFGDKPHWIGVALVGASGKGCSRSGSVSHHCRDVLDGQQRLVTMRLWCTALIDEHVRQTGIEPSVKFPQREPVKLDRMSLMDIDVHSLDSETWETIRSQKILETPVYDKGDSSSISKAYLYFRYILLVGMEALLSDEPEKVKQNKDSNVSIIDSWLEKPDGSPISPQDIVLLLESTILKLRVSVLQHEQSDEDIEVIFETLNSARVELGQFDLFRNYLLTKSNQHGKAQTSLYTKHMYSGEKSIQNAILNLRTQSLDRFLYDFLIGQAVFNNNETIKADATSRIFKRHWESLGDDDRDVKKFLDETLTPSMAAWLAAVSGGDLKKSNMEIDPDTCRTLTRIENLSRGPFTPLTTRIILNWSQGAKPLNQDLLHDQLKLVEIYAARSLLAGVKFSPMRRLVMGACLKIFGKSEMSLKDWVIENSPTDERIIKVLTQSVARDIDGNRVEPNPTDWISEKDLYARADPKQICAIFDGIVRKQEGINSNSVVAPPHKKQTRETKIWVEHLYPQNGDKWVEDLATWNVPPSKMTNRTDSLGNITVLPMKTNQQVGNSSLSVKKQKLKELDVPQWKNVNYFLNATQWTDIEIDKRTVDLANLCLQVWPIPEK
jgi:hypothetical protein